jgi:polyketide biosynthesis enoyl-CoA hydratase PksH
MEIELADAERGNRLAPALVDPLLDALDAAESDPSCRVVLISAAGRDFCSGLDLDGVPDGWLADPADLPPWRLFSRLRTVPVVTVALVDGRATGGGVALAAACDIVIAGQAAAFRFTELLLGLLPATALPFVVNRVGGQHAFRMAMTACEIGPAEAVRIGLADMTFLQAADGVRALLTGLRRVPADTVRAMKRLRDELYPEPPWRAEVAGRALLDRLHDPVSGARLRQLREAGVLP